MLKRTSIYFITLMLVSMFAQASSTTPHWVHYKLLQAKPKLPKKLVILPMSVEVLEVTAGDVEEMVPKWSKKASKNISKSFSTHIKKNPTLKQVKLSRLSKKMAANLDEHMALYKLVVNTASSVNFDHKIRRFDYSIGSGLSKLRKKTGADAAVFIYGQDRVSSAGRITQSTLANIPIVNIFTGQPARLGDSFIHVGIVDLRTGDLLWMNSEYRDDTTDLRDFEDADDMIATVLEWYPGIEQYRAAYIQ